MMEPKLLSKLPYHLEQLNSPPPSIYVVGEPGAMDYPCVAIVGTRKATHYGIRAATCFARSLAKAGFCIVSGLAYGIDAAAHRAALSVGGRTVAVLANSLDRIYPAGNRELARKIVEQGGCVVSEHPLGTPLMRHHFPQRNRIIAGLSLGTIVIEAGKKSGALITGRNAVEENREVFVVPGLFDDEGFSGSHSLIQQGAKLVTRPQEVIDEIVPGLLPFDSPRTPSELEKFFRESGGELMFEEILEVSGWPIADVWQKIEKARESGEIEEISPQSFVWVKPLETDRVTGIPCQN